MMATAAVYNVAAKRQNTRNARGALEECGLCDFSGRGAGLWFVAAGLGRFVSISTYRDCERWESVGGGAGNRRGNGGYIYSGR
jgi:hypothetical protein